MKLAECRAEVERLEQAKPAFEVSELAASLHLELSRALWQAPWRAEAAELAGRALAVARDPKHWHGPCGPDV